MPHHAANGLGVAAKIRGDLFGCVKHSPFFSLLFSCRAAVDPLGAAYVDVRRL